MIDEIRVGVPRIIRSREIITLNLNGTTQKALTTNVGKDSSFYAKVIMLGSLGEYLRGGLDERVGVNKPRTVIGRWSWEEVEQALRNYYYSSITDTLYLTRLSQTTEADRLLARYMDFLRQSERKQAERIVSEKDIRRADRFQKKLRRHFGRILD